MSGGLIRVPVPAATPVLRVPVPAQTPVVRVPVPANPAILQRFMEGPIGPPGKDATTLPLGSPIAAEMIRAGQPITVDRVTGRAHLATAAIHVRAFVAGLAEQDAEPGFPVPVMGRLLTLTDWTAAFGRLDLPPGVALFLSVTPGAFSTMPPSEPGQTAAPLGFASGPWTVAISTPTPVLL